MTEGTVFVATGDLAGHVRGRAVPADRLAQALRTGVGWVPADLALTCFGDIAPGHAFGSVGDLRLLPDERTGADLPGDGETPGTRLFLADQVDLDGNPWAGCPRRFLTAALDALAAEGLQLHAAFEQEFTLGDDDGHPPFSFQRARAAEPFGTDLVTLLAHAGFEPEAWLPEYGPAQFEITVRPATGIAAADRALVIRELVRDLARRRGMRAGFTPLADPGSVGNGVHVHFSLSTADHPGLMYDPAGPARLSSLALRFAGGILRHAGAVLAVTAPSPVSYLRLTPHRWSAGGIFLAERNREALLRVAPTVNFGGADPAAQLHLEYRGADATANPWLVLGVLVRAGLAGLASDAPAPQVWPETEEPADVPPLPSTLDKALAALEADDVARGWFSPVLLDTFVRVKRAELAAVAGQSDAQLCRTMADVY